LSRTLCRLQSARPARLYNTVHKIKSCRRRIALRARNRHNRRGRRGAAVRGARWEQAVNADRTTRAKNLAGPNLSTLTSQLWSWWRDPSRTHRMYMASQRRGTTPRVDRYSIERDLAIQARRRARPAPATSRRWSQPRAAGQGSGSAVGIWSRCRCGVEAGQSAVLPAAPLPTRTHGGSPRS
jgi:hypothetical protein